MSQFGVILALIFSLLIAIFALANNQLIIVNYLYGKTEISAVIVILGAAILGAFVIFLLNIFKQIKAGFRLRSLQSELNEVRSQVNELENERDALLLQLGQLQESSATAASESAAQQHPPAAESYVTGHYMDQQGSGVKEIIPDGDENRQTNAAHSQIESTPEPLVEEDFADQKVAGDKKEEKGF